MKLKEYLRLNFELNFRLTNISYSELQFKNHQYIYMHKLLEPTAVTLEQYRHNALLHHPVQYIFQEVHFEKDLKISWRKN